MTFQIQLFGQDFISLQEHVDIDNLPAELGGTCEDITADKWIKMIETDEIKSGLSEIQYFFKLMLFFRFRITKSRI